MDRKFIIFNEDILEKTNILNISYVSDSHIFAEGNKYSFKINSIIHNSIFFDVDKNLALGLYNFKKLYGCFSTATFNEIQNYYKTEFIDIKDKYFAVLSNGDIHEIIDVEAPPKSFSYFLTFEDNTKYIFSLKEDYENIRIYRIIDSFNFNPYNVNYENINSTFNNHILEILPSILPLIYKK